MQIFLASPALLPCVRYLHLPTPLLCPLVPFLTSPSTLHFFSTVSSKLSYNADATQQAVDPFFACLSWLYVWQEEVEADYPEPILFNALVECVIDKVETFPAAAPLPVTALVS